MGFDSRCHSFWHRDRPSASLRFWLLDQRLSAHRDRTTLLYADRGVDKVYVFSSKAQEFCSPKLAPRGE
jgi:hypothetical protein